MKKCSKCKVEKDLESFYKNNNHKDGRVYACKACHAEYKKKYRKDNKIKISKYTKEYCKKNAVNISIQKKKYRKDNAAKIAIQIKKYSNSEKGKKIATKSKKKYLSSVKGKAAILRNKLKYPNEYKSQTMFRNKNRYNSFYLKVCQSCSIETKLEAHHHDYNFPMDVTYLCKRCHCDWHMKNTALNRVSGIFTEDKK